MFAIMRQLLSWIRPHHAAVVHIAPEDRAIIAPKWHDSGIVPPESRQNGTINGGIEQTVVVCSECGWRGSVAESFKNSRENDSCPQCGNTVMDYEVGD